jgi:hypothetical protein
MQMSTSKSASILVFFMVISSTVLISMTPLRKALKISMSRKDVQNGVPSIAEMCHVILDSHHASA